MVTPAQALMQPIKGQGVCVERLNWLNLGFNANAALWAGYKAAGVRVVRGFIPVSTSTDMGLAGWPAMPSAETVAPFLDGVGLGIAAGIPVFLDLYDVMQPGDTADMVAIVAYLQMMSGLIAARKFNPALCSFGAVNEYAENGNGFWNQYRNALTAALRSQLPNAVLTVNAGDWGALSDYDTTSDPFVLPPTETGGRLIVQVHDYSADAADPAHWAEIETGMQVWSADNGGVPWHIGEAGFASVDGPFGYDPVQWPAVVAAVQQGAPGSAACFWAVTSGDFQMNLSGSDPTLQPGLVSAFQATAGGSPVSSIAISNPGTIVQGAPVTISITTSPPLTAVQIAMAADKAAQNDPFYPPLSGAGPWDIVTLSPAGTGTYTRTPIAAGDFFKATNLAGAGDVDSEGVVFGAAPQPVVTPAQLAPVSVQLAAAQSALAAASASLAALMGPQAAP